MFIAHLPAAYLLSAILTEARPGAARAALLVGALLPDVDLIYQVLWDGYAQHHHTYLTHRPAFWCSGVVIARVLGWVAPDTGQVLRMLSTGALLHLALDTIAGRIDWGWPLLQLAGPLVEVPARFDLWIWSFLLHWTFAAELLICLAAALLWHRRVQ